MKFIDSTIIRVRAGRGGDGLVSFMSAKGMPKLGPDGGDGGNGGDVILRANQQLNTLSALRYKKLYRAEDGARGGTKGCRGRSGKPLIIDVPLGTIAIDNETGETLAEIMEAGQDVIIAKGGRRGLGNIHWVSATHQAPEEFRPGAEGEACALRLELKLLANVGLAGFPNAGKSTLLSRISAARPKIADYPFTTLVPNLGVVDLSDGGRGDYWGEGIVVADVPGLIEGASEGRGLGHAFLKHLERTSLILFVIDPFDPERDAEQALDTLESELQSFSPELAKKRRLLLINKIDVFIDEDELLDLRSRLETRGYEVITASAVDGRGLRELKFRLHELVREEQDKEMRRKDAPVTFSSSDGSIETHA